MKFFLLVIGLACVLAEEVKTPRVKPELSAKVEDITVLENKIADTKEMVLNEQNDEIDEKNDEKEEEEGEELVNEQNDEIDEKNDEKEEEEGEELVNEQNDEIYEKNDEKEEGEGEELVNEQNDEIDEKNDEKEEEEEEGEELVNKIFDMLMEKIGPNVEENKIEAQKDAKKASVISLGCWKDTPRRAIPTLEGKDKGLDGAYRTRKDAINKCMRAALAKGHNVFAVQNGGWCASSATALSTYEVYGPSKACKNGKGGPWANDVYLIGASVLSLGCWKDTPRRAIPTLEGMDKGLNGAYSTRKDAINKCIRAALAKKHNVFAVQDGGWCASSATALSTYEEYGPSKACKNGKGGPWANDVYLIGASVKSLGCWKDTPSRAIPPLEGKDKGLDGAYRTRKDAINKCMRAALAKGHNVFAVQNGGWCASSATALNTYKEYGPSKACKNGKGGPLANDVYLIGGAEPLKSSTKWVEKGFCTKPLYLYTCERWAKKRKIAFGIVPSRYSSNWPHGCYKRIARGSRPAIILFNGGTNGKPCGTKGRFCICHR